MSRGWRRRCSGSGELRQLAGQVQDGGDAGDDAADATANGDYSEPGRQRPITTELQGFFGHLELFSTELEVLAAQFPSLLAEFMGLFHGPVDTGQLLFEAQ